MSSVARRKPTPMRPAPMSPMMNTGTPMPPNECVLTTGVLANGPTALALGVGAGVPVISPGADDVSMVDDPRPEVPPLSPPDALPVATGAAAMDEPDPVDPVDPVDAGAAVPASPVEKSKPGVEVAETRAPPSVITKVLGLPLGVPLMMSAPAVNEALAPDFSNLGVLTNICMPDCDSACAANSFAVAFNGCDAPPMCRPDSSIVAG